MRESKLLLQVFIVCLSVVFIMEVAAGILGYHYRNRVTDFVTDDLKKGLDRYQNKSHETYKDAWDQVQAELQCCGVEEPDDWYLNSTFKANQSPDSCCEMMVPGCGSDGAPIFEEGCKIKMTDYLESKLSGIAAGGIVIALFEILGMICACYVLRSIKIGERV